MSGGSVWNRESYIPHMYMLSLWCLSFIFYLRRLLWRPTSKQFKPWPNRIINSKMISFDSMHVVIYESRHWRGLIHAHHSFFFLFFSTFLGTSRMSLSPTLRRMEALSRTGQATEVISLPLTKKRKTWGLTASQATEVVTLPLAKKKETWGLTASQA